MINVIKIIYRGIKADAVQPEWCRLNEGQCYWKDDSDNPMFWQLETPLTTPLNLQGYVSKSTSLQVNLLESLRAISCFFSIHPAQRPLRRKEGLLI